MFDKSQVCTTASGRDHRHGVLYVGSTNSEGKCGTSCRKAINIGMMMGMMTRGKEQEKEEDEDEEKAAVSTETTPKTQRTSQDALQMGPLIRNGRLFSWSLASKNAHRTTYLEVLEAFSSANIFGWST